MIALSLSVEELGMRFSEEGDEYVGAREVARVLGMSPRTVSRWADSGWLSGFIMIGGQRRFQRKYLEALVDQLRNPKDDRS